MSYRVDIVFDGAVESQEEYDTYEEAYESFLSEIQELAMGCPEYDWQVDLYNEQSELVESHDHEAETLYNVTFTVQVYADDKGSAEARGRDYLRENIGQEEGTVEEAWLQ